MDELQQQHFQSVWQMQGEEEEEQSHNTTSHPKQNLKEGWEWSKQLAYQAIFKEEINKAVSQLPSGEVPGPDRFSAEFFHKYWDLIKEDVILAMKYFSTHSCVPND